MNAKGFGYFFLNLIVFCFLSGCSHGGQEMGNGTESKQQPPTYNAPTPPKLYELDPLAAGKGYAKDVLPLYIDTAKAFSQLAISALALTIVFKEKVLGVSGPMRVSRMLMASWACFLISIGAGISYQWLAIRLISIKNEYEKVYFPLNYGLLWPGNIFGLMLIAFWVGSILLVITSAMQLLHNDKTLVDGRP